VKISDFAARSGLSPDTIRYYERIGLLPRSTRDRGGRRSYGMSDLAWAGFLRKLQAMAMPMRERLEYSRLRAIGPETISVRREMLQDHRTALHLRHAEIGTLIATLDAKIAHYRALETGAAQDADEPASDGGGNGLGTGHDPKPDRSTYDAG